MALLRYKQPAAAPKISCRWPTPDAAFSASAVTGTQFFDLGARAWRDIGSPNFSLVRSGSDVAIRAPLGSASGANSLLSATRDIDSTPLLWVQTVIWQPGTVTSSSVGPWIILYDGGTAQRVRLTFRQAGLIFNYGNDSDVTIVALADFPRGVPVTIAVAVDDAAGAVVYLNGNRVRSSSAVRDWGATTGANNWHYYSNSGTGTEAIVDVVQAATWRNLGFDAARQLSLGARELFEPSYIWVPVSAAATGSPTLSSLSAINVTATSAQPQLTYTF